MADTIPPLQQRSPAGQPDIPALPACGQLTSRPGSTDGWNSWGIVDGDGLFTQLVGIPTTFDQMAVETEAAAWGVCLIDGETLRPEAFTNQIMIDSNFNTSMSTSVDPIEASGGVPVGLVFVVGIGAVIALVSWIRQQSNSGGFDNPYLPQNAYPMAGQTEPNPWFEIDTTIPAFNAPPIPNLTPPDIPMMQRVYPHSQTPAVAATNAQSLEGGGEGGEGGAYSPLSSPLAGDALVDGINPLTKGPYEFHEYPSEMEVAALTFCAYNGYSQNQALEAIYGLTNNNRNTAKYERAKNRWQMFFKQWQSKYKL